MADCGSAAADGDPGTFHSPECAVRRHMEAASTGDVLELRSSVYGPLAELISARSDEEVRQEFAEFYSIGPQVLTVDSGGDSDSRTVTGYYADAVDLEISFTVVDCDGWKVSEIRRGNGMFGALPDPFGS